MEIANTEVAILSQATSRIDEQAIKDLSELELALVGGGNGTVIIG